MSTPHEKLSTRLFALANEGILVSCQGDPRPLSDDADERAEAARTLCPGCPALLACRAAGTLEKFGVWGGVEAPCK